jgi:serine/threonine protein kinase
MYISNIVMEYLPGGPCFKVNQSPVSETAARAFMRDIIMGVEYCMCIFLVYI